jgi:hypothetical protein
MTTYATMQRLRRLNPAAPSHVENDELLAKILATPADPRLARTLRTRERFLACASLHEDTPRIRARGQSVEPHGDLTEQCRRSRVWVLARHLQTAYCTLRLKP